MNRLNMLNLATGIVLVVLLGGAGVYLSKLVNQRPEQSPPEVLLKSSLDCDLNRQACVASIDHRSVALRFKPAVKYLSRFDIEVRSSGFKPHEIKNMRVNFDMPGMSMGINQFVLQQTEQNVWQGIALLPVCISGRKDWQVTLRFGNRALSYSANYALIIAD